MGSPAIFAGTTAKLLKSNLDLNGGATLLSGAVDPTVSATSANIGSVYLSTSTGKLYKKTDNGSSTNWTEIQTTATTNRNVVSKSSNYTVTDTDDIIECNISGGGFTITLPSPSALNAGRIYTVNLTATASTNALTVSDGTLNFKLYTVNECASFVSNGSTWKVDTHYIPSVDTSTTSLWTGSTSAPTKGTVSVDTVVWWREKGNMVGRATYSQSNATGAAVGSGVMLFTVPGGWSIDTANLNPPASLSTGQGIATTLGQGIIGNDANALNTAYQLSVHHYDSTHLYVQFQLNNSNAEVFNSAGPTFTFTTTTLHYCFDFCIPILGWKQ